MLNLDGIDLQQDLLSLYIIVIQESWNDGIFLE